MFFLIYLFIYFFWLLDVESQNSSSIYGEYTYSSIGKANYVEAMFHYMQCIGFLVNISKR